MKKFIKTAICALVMASTVATSALAAGPTTGLNWDKIIHTQSTALYKIPHATFDAAQEKLFDQYSVPGTGQATSGGVTIKVDRILGDRYSAIVLLDITRSDGRAFSGKEYSLMSYYLKQDAIRIQNSIPAPNGMPGNTILKPGVVLPNSQPLSMLVEKNYKFTGNETTSSYIGGGGPSIFINDTANNKLQLVCYFGTSGGMDGGVNDSIIGKKVIFHLQDIAEVLSPGRDYDNPSNYNPIADGAVWDFETNLDYPDVYKEYNNINQTFTTNYRGRDRVVKVDGIAITPTNVYVNGSMEIEDGERIDKGMPANLKTSDGKVTKYIAFPCGSMSNNGWNTHIDGIIDVKNSQNIKAIVLNGHEVELK